MSRNSDSADEVLSLVRAVGLPGYKPAEEQPLDAAAPSTNNGDRETFALIRTCGLAGYDPEKLAVMAQPVKAFPAQTALAPKAPPVAASTAAIPSRLTSRQFAVLEIAPGGESALAALETKMGMPFAADYQGQPYWSAASTSEGGTRRAFTFMGDQLASFADLLGDLGSPALRLAVSGIEARSFNPTGPGADARASRTEPPQLPQGLPKALRSALER